MILSLSACGEGGERGEILQYLNLNACFDTGPQLANSINEIEFLPSSNNIFGATHYLYKFLSWE